MNTKIILIVLALYYVIISCNRNIENPETQEQEVLGENVVEMNDDQYKMAGIELGQIEKKVLSNTIKTNGIVNATPQNLVTITAKLGGTVKNTSLLQGSYITKGQILATLENFEFIELQQNYLENKNLLELAEADYNRQKDLYNENINSAKTYQQALSEYKSFKTKVNALEQKLLLLGVDAKKLNEDKISNVLNIISPINGYIKTVNINVGKFVKADDIMFEIINNQNLTIELTIFEKDIEKISIGQKINFSTPNTPEKIQSAIVYQVGKSINENKTITIYASINNNSNNYLIQGMFINAEIETTTNSTTALPTESVLTFDDKNYIFVEQEKKLEKGKNITLFKMIEVTKGTTNNGYTEVILPNNFEINNSKIVIKGAYNLLSALKNAGDMAC